MAAMRVQLTQDVYMPLDGQWTIVLSGSIIDVPSGTLSPAHTATVAGTPALVTKPTSVSGVRKK